MRVVEPEIGNHWDEARLEAYSMGRLPEEEIAPLEEHLLLCDTCRQRLQESEKAIRLIRYAAERSRMEPEPEPRRGMFPWLIPALAAAVVVLVVGLTLRPTRQGAPVPAAINLEATRGGGLVAQIPAGKPLLLKPNLDGLPGSPEYHLQIRDRTGKRVWQGNFKPPTVAAAGQPPGIYFVELYSLPGTLLREYAMEAKAGQ